MRPPNSLPSVYLCHAPIDFRKGINGLSIFVEQNFPTSPFSEHLFVFVNKRKDKIKILYWERSGFCLWQKRLEEERFKWPKSSSQKMLTINGQQLNWLLDGYDLSRMMPHKTLEYSTVL